MKTISYELWFNTNCVKIKFHIKKQFFPKLITWTAHILRSEKKLYSIYHIVNFISLNVHGCESLKLKDFLGTYKIKPKSCIKQTNSFYILNTKKMDEFTETLEYKQKSISWYNKYIISLQKILKKYKFHKWLNTLS